jgi:hypothetical protein
MTNDEAATLSKFTDIWVATQDGGRRPDHAMAIERYADGRVMVETRINGWMNADQVHWHQDDAAPGRATPPPPPDLPAA